MLVQDILDKAKYTTLDLRANSILLRGVLTAKERPLLISDQDVGALDIYWCEYLERTSSVLSNIKEFVYKRAVFPFEKKKVMILSPYILPKFMNEDNLNQTILTLNLEESKEELDTFIRLLVKDARGLMGLIRSLRIDRNITKISLP